MVVSSARSIWMSSGSEPRSTMMFLFSSFLKASVRREPATARCTLGSTLCSRETRGGMPPSCRTLFLMPLFSCARLVMASLVRRHVCAGTPLRCTSLRPAYRRIMDTSVGSAPASQIAAWCSTLIASRPRMKQMSRSSSSTPLHRQWGGGPLHARLLRHAGAGLGSLRLLQATERWRPQQHAAHAMQPNPVAAPDDRLLLRPRVSAIQLLEQWHHDAHGAFGSSIVQILLCNRVDPCRGGGSKRLSDQHGNESHARLLNQCEYSHDEGAKSCMQAEGAVCKGSTHRSCTLQAGRARPCGRQANLAADRLFLAKRMPNGVPAHMMGRWQDACSWLRAAAGCWSTLGHERRRHGWM
jgi:hypothetical protein